MLRLAFIGNSSILSIIFFFVAEYSFSIFVFSVFAEIIHSQLVFGDGVHKEAEEGH